MKTESGLATATETDLGGETASAPHRRRPIVLVVLGVAMVPIILAGLWLVFGGDRAKQSSEDDARKRVGTTLVGGNAAPGAAPLTAGPAPGVYRFTGSGRENTSFPPLTEQQGPSMPATVSQQPDGCWEFRIDFNTHHWQSWTYCSVDGRMEEHHGASYARRDFGGIDVENITSFTCETPPIIFTTSDQPGTSRTRSCSGTGSLITTPVTSTGTMTIVGNETVDVGGQQVLAVHVRYDLTYSGAQSGTEKSEFWFDAGTGLPLRNERHLEVGTETPFGQITYTEDANFALQQLEPV